MTVVIVDHTGDSRPAVRDLTSRGARVLCCASLRQAVGLLDRFYVDVVAANVAAPDRDLLLRLHASSERLILFSVDDVGELSARLTELLFGAQAAGRAACAQGDGGATPSDASSSATARG